MNTITPRIFIAATRQNDGKTTTSLGLLATLQATYPRVGFIKPVGQRFVEVAEHKIDEDIVLMDEVYRLNCPLADMSPIAVEPDFTRKYLQSANYDILVSRIQDAFDRVAWEKDFVLCEGSGHAGVGSVFDLSNARVAKILNAKVIIVSQGGIGRPIDEVCLNQALFEKEGVEVIGVIVNKVLPRKIDLIRDVVQRGFKRKGLELLGVLPYEPILTQPTLTMIREELGCRQLNESNGFNHLINGIVVGAMSVQNATRHLKHGALLITPGDREDILEAAAAGFAANPAERLAGIVLTGDLEPSDSMLRAIRELPFPVLLAKDDSYEAAARVHDMIVKTRSTDTEKIQLIRDIIARNINVDRIIEAL